MSHFSVFVTIPPSVEDAETFIEQALAPYDEDLDTEPYFTDDDPTWYVQYHLRTERPFTVPKGVPTWEADKIRRKHTDVPDKDAPEVVEFMSDPQRVVDFLCSRYDGNDAETWRYHDGTYQRETTYNPNSKWDWYTIGGRWTGFLQLKAGRQGIVGRPGLMTAEAPDQTADIALIADVDWDAMREEQEQRAGEIYDAFRATVGEHPEPESWETVREAFSNIENARAAYHAQPAIRALRETKDERLQWTSYVDFAPTRQEHIRRAGERAISTYALVHEGEWIAKGRMGWFGISHDDENEDEYRKRACDLIQSLGDGWRIAVVDCHI